jgi:Membrane bound beta barrel domain (DUF5777)
MEVLLFIPKNVIMKLHPIKTLRILALLLLILAAKPLNLQAQDSVAPVKKSYVKNTFEGNYIIDDQSVVLPVKHSLEADIQHRFGTMSNGIHDFFGLFNVTNVRLAVSYTFTKDFQLGLGLIGDRMQTDLNAKYALVRQTKDGSMPVSITFFGNVAVDPRDSSYDNSATFRKTSDHFSYFSQLIFARKISEKLSLQVSPSWSHFNSVVGSDGTIVTGTHYDHFALSFSGRYKITPKTSIIANYDLPISTAYGALPNISAGFEFKTSGHDFQLFAGNYGYILPQNNSFYNQNDFNKSQFLLGFNITRLWNP